MNAADLHLRYLRERQADVTRRLVRGARDAATSESVDRVSEDRRPRLRLVGGTEPLEPSDGTLAS